MKGILNFLARAKLVELSPEERVAAEHASEPVPVDVAPPAAEGSSPPPLDSGIMPPAAVTSGIDADLAAAEFVSRHGYLEKEPLRLEQEGELATQRSRLHEIAAAIREGQQQRRALLAESRRQALDSLDDGERKAAALVQERLKAEARGQAMTLTAPVAGTVQQLAVHTVGGVVTPAQGLMAIVPKDEAVEVEAFVDNKDIGFIHAGQEAQVKIETFPFTRYGTVAATVTQVSSDAIRQEKPGRDHGALVYALRARLAQAMLRVDEKWLRLSPGMAVTVEVKTGQRRVIEYFLNPLLQYGQESLRER